MKNRRIKFRIWNNKNKQWIHGPHERNDMDGVNLFGENILFGNLLDGVSIEDLNELEDLQYTGLDDINGKNIFEGDIIKITYTDATPEGRLDFETVKRLVRWDSVELKWGLEYTDFPTFCERLSDFKGSIEIIGNIFENPDLLKNN